jgi:hypothetical protein
MTAIGFILCIAFIAVTAILLYRRFNPQCVLIFEGLSMISIAAAMGLNHSSLKNPPAVSYSKSSR